MKSFKYLYPANADSVPALLAEANGKAIPFGGGTDALDRMKEGILEPEQLINLKKVKELDYIKEDSAGLHIGSATKLTDILENKLAQAYPGFTEAVSTVGTIQLRNMGTLGGNLCQRPRCWYFRNKEFHCLRKHGDTCFAIYGENKYHAILGGGPCYIVYPSDIAPMLIALDAKVEIAGQQGARQIDIQDLYVLPEDDPYNETILKPDEYVTKIMIPASSKSLKGHYLKFRERKSFDFAMVSVAVAAKVSGNKLSQVRIALGGVAPLPWRAEKAEKALEGKTASEQVLLEAGNAEMVDAEAMTQNEYKIVLGRNLIKRTIQEMIAA